MCRPRWCPHNRNAADAMTKFKGAHSEPLFNLLRTGMYTLKGEKNELADRAVQLRTTTDPRHKVSATKAVSESTFFVHTPLGSEKCIRRVLSRANFVKPPGGSSQRDHNGLCFSLLLDHFLAEITCPESQMKFCYLEGFFPWLDPSFGSTMLFLAKTGCVVQVTDERSADTFFWCTRNEGTSIRGT